MTPRVTARVPAPRARERSGDDGAPRLSDLEAQEARAARAVVEAALDVLGWPWSRRLSLWLDALATIEERAA